jgi:hypothetical protein
MSKFLKISREVIFLTSDPNRPERVTVTWDASDPTNPLTEMHLWKFWNAVGLR